MRKLSMYCVALLLLVLTILPTQAQSGTVVDIAASNAEFSTLVQAVEAANLTDALSGDGPITVFAPTNDAFTRLGSAYGFSIDDLLADTETLALLLQYHVVAGNVFSGDAIALVEGAGGEALVPTLLEGTAIGLTVVNGTLTVNGVADVVSPFDVAASNGVVHAIDNVVFPGVLLERLEGLGGGGAEDAAAASNESSIYGIASSNPDFSTLSAVIDAAGAVDLLDIGFTFTVFAPTNAAFDALFEEIGFTAEEVLAQPELLETILRYHVVEENFTALDLFLTDAPPATLQGETHEYSGEDGSLVIDGRATVVTEDLEAFNGTIQVIDAVLIPDAGAAQVEILQIDAETIPGVARDTEGFSILTQAIQASGNIQLLEVGFPFTVFAPTDDAFNALFDSLGVSADEALASPELLDAVLRYHILEETLTFSDLALRSSDELETVLGETISFTATGGNLLVNGEAAIVTPDVEARNGVIHVIDAVLVPQAAIDMMMAAGEEEMAEEDMAEEDMAAEEEMAEEEMAEEEAAEEEMAEEEAGDEEMAEEDMDAMGTIADIVAGDEQFSILAQVVSGTGNTPTLTEGGPFTVFAPTDEAFEALLALIGVDAPTALALPELLEPVLLYHVIEGEVDAAAVVELDGMEVTTVQGETITVMVTDDGVVLVSAIGEVMVTATDIVASNGIVHVVDAVLVPAQTVEELAGLGINLGE